MALTSKFYTGPVNNVEWAQGAVMLGYRYAVGGATDFLVAPNSAAVRGVSIQPGEASGGGIVDTSTAVEPLELPYNAANRWHLVGLNRTWGATNASALDSIEGTAVMQIPTRPNVRGVEDFQPLALCYVAGDSAEVSQVIDLRTVAYNGGVLFANSDLVRSYMNRVGTRIMIADEDGWVQEWTRILVENTAAWVSNETTWNPIDYTVPESTGNDTIFIQRTHWAVKTSCRVARDGLWRNVHLVFDRSSSSFQFDDVAGRINPSMVIAKLHSRDWPRARVSTAANIYTTSGGLFNCAVSIEVDGDVVLTAGPRLGTVGPTGPTNTLTIDATYVR